MNGEMEEIKQAVERHKKETKLKKAELLGINFVTTEKGTDLLNELSRVFALVDMPQKYNNEDLLNAEDSIQKTECSMRIAEEIENLTFIDGVLVTWEIFNKILDKRLRDDNGDPEGIIYKGRKYDYLGIINDDVTDLLLNKVLEHGYFKIRGYKLMDQFGINV